MNQAIDGGLLRRQRSLGAAVLSALLIVALPPSPVATSAEDAGATIEVVEDYAVRYVGSTTAETNLLIEITEETITMVNRGNEPFGDVVGCEHVPSGPDQLERAVCPTPQPPWPGSPPPALWIFAGGTTTQNRVAVTSTEDWLVSDFSYDGTSAPDMVQLAPRSFFYVNYSGGEGNDFLDCPESTCHGSGGPGDDALQNSAGESILEGGRGQDRLRGGQGIDQLAGNRGRDLIYGGRGRDWLWGHGGRDVLYGGRDQDQLAGREAGRPARDELRCGPGTDRFNSDRLDLVASCEGPIIFPESPRRFPRGSLIPAASS